MAGDLEREWVASREAYGDMDGTPDPVDVERIRPARSGRVRLDRHDVKIARYVDGPAMTDSQLTLRRVSGAHSQRLMPRRKLALRMDRASPTAHDAKVTMATSATSGNRRVSTSRRVVVALAVATTLGGCGPALESCPPASDDGLGCFRDVLASLEVATETKLQYHWEGYWYSRLEEVLFEVSGNAEIGTLSIEASFPSLAGHPIPDRVDGFLRVMDEIAPGSRQWATEVISSDEPDGIRSFGAFDAYVYEELPPLYDAPPTAEPRIHVELTSL